MPETVTQDEVVSLRSNPTRGGHSARPQEDESVHATNGTVEVDRSGIENENHAIGDRRGRAFKKSTAELLDKFEKEAQDARAPAPHEEGDPDEDEAPEAEAASDDAEPAQDEVVAEGESTGDAAEAEETEEAIPVNEWQTKAQTLEQRNRELLTELDTARKTPKNELTTRQSALIAAEASYIDEGSVASLRKYLSVITGAAPDSKEVEAELRGLYADLTAVELGVPLDQNQQALRDNARTRLLLARDRREKADADKKPDADNSANVESYEQAAKYVDNLLVVKGQSGTSLADEYPMLMDLAEDFDGFKPSEVLARAIRQEIMTGTLDPKTADIDMVRMVAPKIEKHYDDVAKRIEAARAKQSKKLGTTTSVKPKVATDESTEQRQSKGARTLSNAAASRAPAKLPKATKQKAQPIVEKSRKDFKTDAEWRNHLLKLHFPDA